VTVSVLQLAWMLRETEGLHSVWLLKCIELESLLFLFSYGLLNIQTYRRFKVNNSFFIVINQQDAAVRGQFYFTAGSLYTFWVLSTPISSCILPTWPSPNLATLEEGSCNDNMTRT
jgi:hypothetical protein